MLLIKHCRIKKTTTQIGNPEATKLYSFPDGCFFVIKPLSQFKLKAVF